MTRADANVHQGMHQVNVLNGLVEVDPVSGGLAAVHLTEPDTSFISRPAGAGLLRLALPRSDYPAHFVEVGTHGRPAVEVLADGGMRLRYDGLTTVDGPIPIQIELDLSPAADGLHLRARVHNGGTVPIPQVIFPQLLGLEAIDGVDGTRIQMGSGKMLPLRELAMQPDDAHYLDLRLQRYIAYGKNMHTMKWLDYGSTRCGLSLYAQDMRDTVQGLLVVRPDRANDRIDLGWVHYPFIQPGETWDSGDFVLLVHPGDWYASARAYQRYASEHYPYHAPKRLREALGVRTMWAAVRSTPPTFPLSAIPEYAAELADPDLDLAELIVWHWWLKNGYPIFLDPRLGTEDEFKAALDRCRELGVPVSLFVSHHLQRDTDETNPTWVFENAAHQRVLSNWTYGPGFAPKFGPPFMGTHSMVQGSGLSPGWRAKGLEEYQRIQDKYGPVSICFDQFGAWDAPNFNPAADGKPDQEGEKLLEFGQQARALIHKANQHTNPDATFSGEHISDTRVPVLDYTWEWHNAADIEAAAPFRYVFPQFRLNANVNEHPRGALRAFMEGALLNVMPGNMHSFRLRDCPDLVVMLRKLTVLRRRFLRYFTEGQFRFREGLTVSGAGISDVGVSKAGGSGASGRLYTHGSDILMVVVNPTDAPVEATISLDPSVWGATLGPSRVTTYALDGCELEQMRHAGGALERSVRLGADELCLIEVVV